MAFSLDDKLSIATGSGIKLYNIKTHSFIFIPLLNELPPAIAFLPDCSRLAVGNLLDMCLYSDIQAINSSSPPSKEEASQINALALSRDYSRLACGFLDGTVGLWEINPTKQRITSHRDHQANVLAVAFQPDSKVFASGSRWYEGTIELWNCGDGLLCGTLKAPVRLHSLALSNSVLVASWFGGVTLWSLDILILIHVFDNPGNMASIVSITENSALIAVAYHHTVFLLDAVNHTTIVTFEVPHAIDTMTFLPDNSQLVIKPYSGDFLTLDLINKRTIKEPTLEQLIQFPNTPFLHDVPIWFYQHEGGLQLQSYCSALFSQHKSSVPVLWIPKDFPVTAWTHGSSMIALGCRDGRVILLRLSTRH